MPTTQPHMQPRLPDLYRPFCWQSRMACKSLSLRKLFMQGAWANNSRRLWRLDFHLISFLAAWEQGQKNAVQVQRRACWGRNVFVKNNHVLKMWSWLAVPNMLQHFVITSAQPLPCQISATFPAIMRNLKVTIAESIWRAFHWALILWS